MDISVIIPTTAKELRGPFLVAALDSLFAQSAHRAVPIVVVNGTSYVPDLLRALQSDKRLRVIYREEPGEMAALAAGRRIVDTEYFGVLDDDDLYLPNALAVRVAALQETPAAAAVITNGHRRTAAGESLLLENFGQISADPLTQLMRQNWMTPPGALFRTASVGAEIFAEAPTMLEYTYFGLRLASTGTLRFVDVPTFIKQDLLADAITRTNEYVMLQPRALEYMMTLALPRGVQRRLGQKLAASHHHVSALELSQGHLGPAWRAHLKSLRSLYGLRYLSYTRHLLGSAGRVTMVSGAATATLLAAAEACAELAGG
jgi:glycosyltransferase involved in cell wall biosynthesis